jgi:hypothetical protein
LAIICDELRRKRRGCFKALTVAEMKVVTAFLEGSLTKFISCLNIYVSMQQPYSKEFIS